MTMGKWQLKAVCKGTPIANLKRSPVAQWVKRWPVDLAIPGSSPAWVEDLSSRKQDSTASSPQAEFEPGIRRGLQGQVRKLISGLYCSFGLNLNVDA